jgi:hypothetical protein
MSFMSVAQWVAHTGLGIAIRKSTFVFPAVEVVHVLGLTLLLGSILAMDLRLLGAGMRKQSAAEVAVLLAPLFWTGLGLALATGTILFIGEPVKCFFNEAFWWKMGLLAAALLFHLTLFRWASRSDGLPPVAYRSAAVLSLGLWFGVGVAGRVIGFI